MLTELIRLYHQLGVPLTKIHMSEAESEGVGQTSLDSLDLFYKEVRLNKDRLTKAKQLAVSPLSIIHNVRSEITPNDSHRVAVLHLWPVVERVKFLKCTDQPPSKLSVVHHHLLLGEAHLGAQHHHVKHLIDSMNSY